MAALVEIRDLRVEATTDSGRVIEIIKGVSFDIAAGEIVALIGESGSGKTTIAMTLLGYARPGCRISAGAVRVDGHDMTTISERERARIRGAKVAYVPQSAAAAFNPATRIIDQVIEVTRIHGLMSPEAARLKAIRLFTALSLPQPATIGQRYPHQVSGGQLQRVAAAMALMSDPDVMIFDEPTTALDVTTQVEVLRAFKAVLSQSGIAGIYVSHDLAVVAQVADRIVVLQNGAVQEIGTTQAILSDARHPYTQQLLAAFTPKSHPSPVDAPTRAKPLLEVENLSVGYGPRQPDGHPFVRAVRSVSLTVERGRNLGIIGESGCGKSTLARAIAGILPPYAGHILFDGHQLANAGRHRRRDELRRMQIVFQHADTALNPAKTIEDILGRPIVFYPPPRPRRGHSPHRPSSRHGPAATLRTSKTPRRTVRRTEATRQFRPRLGGRTQADPVRRNHVGAGHSGGGRRHRPAQGTPTRTRVVVYLHQPRSVGGAGDL